jgi:hypothetical protein
VNRVPALVANVFQVDGDVVVAVEAGVGVEENEAVENLEVEEKSCFLFQIGFF